jgi:hypothetical protein
VIAGTQVIGVCLEKEEIPSQPVSYPGGPSSRAAPSAGQSGFRSSRFPAAGSCHHSAAFARFRFAESSVMATELAAQYPDIKSYVGQGVDNPSLSTRFDLSPAGLRAYIDSPEGTVYIDPYPKGTCRYYISYYKRDLNASRRVFEEVTPQRWCHRGRAAFSALTACFSPAGWPASRARIPELGEFPKLVFGAPFWIYGIDYSFFIFFFVFSYYVFTLGMFSRLREIPSYGRMGSCHSFSGLAGILAPINWLGWFSV